MNQQVPGTDGIEVEEIDQQTYDREVKSYKIRRGGHAKMFNEIETQAVQLKQKDWDKEKRTLIFSGGEGVEPTRMTVGEARLAFQRSSGSTVKDNIDYDGTSTSELGKALEFAGPPEIQ